MVMIQVLSTLVIASTAYATESISDARQLVESFSRGERSSYRSKGVSKAQGLDIEFQMPKSWKQSVTERSISTPNLVAFFEPEDAMNVSSSGYISAPRSHLQVNVFSESFLDELGVVTNEKKTFWEKMTPTKEERELARDIFSDEAALEFYPSVSPILDFSNNRILVDGWPGTIISAQVSYHSTRTGVTSTSYIMTLCILYRQYLASICIAVAKDLGENETAFRQRYSIYKPLIHAIASTVVIHNQDNGRDFSVKGSSKTTKRMLTTKQPHAITSGVIIIKKIEDNLYLCKRDGQRLVVDFSEHPSYKGRVLQRGSLIGGSFILQAEGTKQTMVNGKIETLPLVKLIESATDSEFGANFR